MPASIIVAIFKVICVRNSPLRRLAMSRCGLTDLHVLRSFLSLNTGKYLTHLHLSGNPLSDSVITALCGGIEGQMQLLDVSACSVSMNAVGGGAPA